MMKKTMSLLASLFCLSAFACSGEFSGSKQQTIINVKDLATSTLIDVMEGLRPDLVVEFSAGTLIPLHIFLKGNIMELVENPDKAIVKIDETFYLKCEKDEVILSADLMNWKPFLDFFTGAAKIILDLQDGQPEITIGAEANRRDA